MWKLGNHLLTSRVRLVILVVSLIPLAGLTTSAQATPTAHTAATCSDYVTQADAQRAADTTDSDGDGIYCVISPR